MLFATAHQLGSVVKHARAGQVTVTLDHDGIAGRLVVADNGVASRRARPSAGWQRGISGWPLGGCGWRRPAAATT